MHDDVVSAIYEDDFVDRKSCQASDEMYWEEHFANWIAFGNVDAQTSSFENWIAVNEVDDSLEVRNELVSEVIIQGY